MKNQLSDGYALPGRITENKIFIGTFVLSCLMHVGMLVRFSYTSIHYSRKPLPKTEMIYQSTKSMGAKRGNPERERNSRSHTFRERKIIKPSKGLLKDQFVPGAGVKDAPQLAGTFKLDKRQPNELDTKSVMRKITISQIQSEKITNPTYINYYQIIRNKIKNRAYLNYSKTESGEVYLTFVLISDGSLKQLKIIEERTSANVYLRDIGLKSIQEASPFPSFPKDLKYPELTFNVVISFEVKD